MGGGRRDVGAVATRLDLEPSTITPLVKRLEAAGLVTRTRRPDDERSVSVALTPRGAALKTESRCLGEALFTKAGMAAEEMIALNSKVRDLHDALTGRTSKI